MPGLHLADKTETFCFPANRRQNENNSMKNWRHSFFGQNAVNIKGFMFCFGNFCLLC